MSRVGINTKAISDGEVKTSDLATGAVTADKIANPLASLTVNNLTAGGLAFPVSDGSNNQVLTTDGNGSLSFNNAASSSQTLSVIARSSTVSVTITSGILPIVARSGTINVGVS